ncbi:BppU family phage baseplate upper protein [Ligilactobacillus salivarius]|uniref:BppU family phage baseplate upper protein n=1 Tax=Ligilactobacillus salivarius TaxID=1624 RepID=UPI0025A4A55A|nr:BppU family phage baseplate upper protein [Ligilactobacillus salivarius]MDM8262745.1 BppU family phage baseplate upper protein [Ligilactobacillus salivarius]
MAIESILPDGYKTAELIEADGIIRIDIDKPYRQTYLNLSAYFNGRQNDSMSLKKFQFYENDAPKNLTNCTITIHAQKPDGKTIVASDCFNIIRPQVGIVEVSFPRQTFTAMGTVLLYLVISNNQGTAVSTNTMYFENEGNLSLTINSDNYDSELEAKRKEILDKLNSIETEVNDRLASINALSKGLENSYNTMAQALDLNTQSINDGMSATKNGANSFTGSNSFSKLVSMMNGLNVSNGLTVDGVQFSDKANKSDLLNPDNVFQFKGEIEEDTNWNSVDKTGYYSVWIKNAHAGLHVPGTNNGDGSNVWGTLLVFAYGETIYQMFINFGGFRLFIRSKTGSPTTEWNGWASAQFNNPESN